MKIKLLTGLFLLGIYLVQAQEYQRPEIDIQSFVEALFQTPDEDLNYDDLYESLYQLYANPIDLNHTNKAELSTLFLLTYRQVMALLSYITEHGPILSIYELQVVEGFDHTIIQSILPFVVVRSRGDYTTKGNLLQRIQQEENSYFILRSERILESQEGYQREDSSRYLGSPWKIYGRIRANHAKDFSVGMTFEKDPGEQVVCNKANRQYGFDYYSFHLFLENKGSFKRLVIGDYQMQFGQGLILGAGFNPGKGAETITTVKRISTGIKPYTSVLESGFMRGAGLTYRYQDIDFSPFVSFTNRDAFVRQGTDMDNLNEFISSIQTTGLHRSYKELSAKNGINERTVGVNITYNEPQNKNLQAGVTFLSSHYSTPLARIPNNYNQFEFQGKSNYNIGAFANYNWNNFLLFMEIAQAKSGGKAWIAGLMSSLSPIISVSFSYRHYSKDYHAFYGNAFGESSRNINESGQYWGIKITPSRKYFFSAYYDQFQFPWLKFGVESPSQGHEYLIRANYHPTKRIKLYAQIREQAKGKSIPSEGNTKTLGIEVKRNYIGNLDLSVNDKISLKSRIQFSSYTFDDKTTKGMAIAQDFNLKLGKWVVSARIALFDNEDFQNRQYLYEKNLQYLFVIPAYIGQGTRRYLMVRYKPTRKITLWTRIAQFDYTHLDHSGSGLNKVDESTKTDIKLQIRYKI